jgi:hypothetical protein
MGVDFGGRSLTSAEAWRLGVAQPYVVGGIVLLVLALLFYRGARWVRWPVLLWFPVTFGFGVLWSLQRGVGTFDSTEFVLEAVPVILIWLWFSWRAFFRSVDG